jgi:hypothetical protein
LIFWRLIDGIYPGYIGTTNANAADMKRIACILLTIVAALAGAAEAAAETGGPAVQQKAQETAISPGEGILVPLQALSPDRRLVPAQEYAGETVSSAAGKDSGNKGS